MTDSMRDIVETHNRGLHERNHEVFASIFADDVAVELPTGAFTGIPGLLATIDAFTTAFPDLKLTPREIWAADNGVVAEQVFTGTHDGPMVTPDGEVPPTGRPVTFTLIDTFVVRDGKVSEHRVYWDNYSFMSQLGLV